MATCTTPRCPRPATWLRTLEGHQNPGQDGTRAYCAEHATSALALPEGAPQSMMVVLSPLPDTTAALKEYHRAP